MLIGLVLMVSACSNSGTNDDPDTGPVDQGPNANEGTGNPDPNSADKPKYTIGGTVTGLNGTLVLQNNLADNLTVSANGSFVFAGAIETGGSYSISILSQPATQSCNLSNTDGAVADSNIANVNIQCTNLPTYTVSGSVSGLTGLGLQLSLNGADPLDISADGPFSFNNGLADGVPYLVSVAIYPMTPPQLCTITGGDDSQGGGTIASANVSGITVSCENALTLGGTVTGLAPAEQLTLRNNGQDNTIVAGNGSFNMTTPLLRGQSYVVTTANSPTGKLCSIVNGSGISDEVNITNILVSCDTGTRLHAKMPEGLANYNNCRVFSDGSLKCWGPNMAGSLGQGLKQNHWGDEAGETGDNLPYIELSKGTNILKLVRGTYNACAIRADNSLKCWGSRGPGLGIGTGSTVGDEPGEMGGNLLTVNLGAGMTAIDVAVASDHTCAILNDGYVRCWGDVTRKDALGYPTTEPVGLDPLTMGDSLSVLDLGTHPVTTQPFKAKAITAGNAHFCVILETDEVKCWGYHYQGQLGQITSTFRLGGAAGDMGDNLKFTNLGTGRTAKQIVAGSTHTCAILDTNEVKCWGRNDKGQLGQGDTTNRGRDIGSMGDDLPAVDLGADVDSNKFTALAVATGHDHTCAILNDSSVKCWGNNIYGQLGLGDVANRGDEAGEMGNALLPVDLGTVADVPLGAKAIATSGVNTCAILTNDTVKCWGYSSFGENGLGDTVTRGDEAGEMGNLLPTLNLGTDFVPAQIVASTLEGFFFGKVCAVSTLGKFKCWGQNGNSLNTGDLGLEDHMAPGDEPGELATIPAIQLGAGKTALSVVSTVTGHCALLNDGSVKCWGYNIWGQLGLGHQNDIADEPGELGDSLLSLNFGEGRSALSIGYGNEFGCALLDNGQIKCWGVDSTGQLGTGGLTGRTMAPSDPVLLGDGITAKALAVGYDHACAVLADNNVKCWGGNANGQLGYEDSVPRGTQADLMGNNLPSVALGSGRTAVSVSAGNRFTCAILDNYSLKCWGANQQGQLAQGHTDPLGNDVGEMGNDLSAIDFGNGRKVQKVSAGTIHACALLDDFSLACWGHADTGALASTNGTPAMGDEVGESPVIVDLGINHYATDVYASNGFTCAILDDDTTKCWGRNDNGQLGAGDKFPRMSAGDELPPLAF